MTVQWNVEDLKQALSACPEVKGWVLVQGHMRRRESYFLLEPGGALAVDQARDAEAEDLFATLFVDAGKEGRQGETTRKLFPALALAPQLASAIAAARQTDHRGWSLPAAPTAAETPQTPETADPAMLEDLDGCMRSMGEQIAQAVAAPRPTRFNSAELFMSVHRRTVWLSNGLSHKTAQTRIYVEAAYSMHGRRPGTDAAGGPAGAPVSDEYLHTQWAVGMDGISVADLFAETSARAERMLDVSMPQPGSYAVIVDADVLSTLFHDQVSHLTAINAYNKLPFIEPGQDLVQGAHGDLLTIALDPTLRHGAASVAYSGQGVPQRRMTLVEGNKVLATAADQQHASYLDMPGPTTVRGNVVVQAGTATLEELSRGAPQVIEILQFSGLFTDATSGTFSSEIRLARLYDNVAGTVRYLKGGSLSGAIGTNFKGLRLSGEVVRHAMFWAGAARGQGYVGPSHALLSDVSIAA